VPWGCIRRQTRHRLLRDAVLHHQRADSHSVVGVVLDQRRCGRGARQHGPAHRPDADHAVDKVERWAASRVLRQGDRRLDVDMPCLCIRFTHRVRYRQRLVTAGRPTFQAVRWHRITPTPVQRCRRRRRIRPPRADAHAATAWKPSFSSSAATAAAAAAAAGWLSKAVDDEQHVTASTTGQDNTRMSVCLRLQFVLFTVAVLE